ncbi:hypothetical protein MPDQ_001762 [Monascus purpureus]|uniref:PQ loop repeat-containing protein 2 n=1 Tax=Monascus purpureus TaxID=5098 RepID=A0A507R0B1_MONPU|nr:hypothetical protein MPDQ_001762 [Monascus purpureus]BDD59657.1 hypothetical protein MAP00_004852 [Monascus purpureus]
MPPPLLRQITAIALPDHCEPSSPYLAALSSYLHICLPTPLALISSLLGTLSIVSWLFAQIPQIYKNYQLQSTAGLSAFFLIEWCLGDSANLVGSLLTRQAGWQVVVAAYYVLVDITLVAQFFWYTHGQRKWRRYARDHPPHSRRNPPGSGVLEGVSLPEDDHGASASRSPSELSPRSLPKDVDPPKKPIVDVLAGPSPSYSHNEKKHSFASRRTVAGNGSSLSTRTVLLTSMLCAVLANAAPTEPHLQSASPFTAASESSTLEIIGRVASWISSVLYLFSRPPQLYKNYRRKSTSGLSPLLFMAAFCGNFFYSASLLTNPNAWFDFPPYGGGGWASVDGNSRVEWIVRTLPFFLGAAGVLALDAFMGVQFLVYGEGEPVIMVDVGDEDGKGEQTSHWTAVRGWMRGWIPSVSPDRGSIAEASEEEAALLPDERPRNAYGAI